MSGKTRNIAIQVVLQQTPRGVGVLLYISEHKSVCHSFVTRMNVRKYSKKFSGPCFSLPSKLFRTNSSFLLSPDFLDHAVARKGLILGNTGCLLLFRQTINICQEALFDWLSRSQDKTSLFIPKAIPLIVNN